jgi:hypothetical protein
MLIENESPEEYGYDRIRYNLSESSIADQHLSDIGVTIPDLMLIDYGSLLPEQRNILRFIFLDPAARTTGKALRASRLVHSVWMQPRRSRCRGGSIRHPVLGPSPSSIRPSRSTAEPISAWLSTIRRRRRTRGGLARSWRSRQTGQPDSLEQIQKSGFPSG